MRASRGFTLIEMMIVILVIAVLATIVGLAVRNAGERSKQAVLTDDLAALNYAVQLYSNDMGAPPADLVDMTSRSNVDPRYYGPYITGIPKHPYTGLTTSWVYNSTTGKVTTP